MISFIKVNLPFTFPVWQIANRNKDRQEASVGEKCGIMPVSGSTLSNHSK